MAPELPIEEIREELSVQTCTLWNIIHPFPWRFKWLGCIMTAGCIECSKYAIMTWATEYTDINAMPGRAFHYTLSDIPI
ncbi:Uncharacterised protein [Salmonella enterica subsp. indica]|uniref:Uncharacterized protein n=1 Tax=Salmonella enterica subsp. indica TaxID=59207 RepID=A0A379XQW7_SALER|nr:Uncharacterised protein [Salmonella enterica subsp. indica]